MYNVHIAYSTYIIIMINDNNLISFTEMSTVVNIAAENVMLILSFVKLSLMAEDDKALMKTSDIAGKTQRMLGNYYSLSINSI